MIANRYMRPPGQIIDRMKSDLNLERRIKRDKMGGSEYLKERISGPSYKCQSSESFSEGWHVSED